MHQLHLFFSRAQTFSEPYQIEMSHENLRQNKHNENLF